MVRSLTSTICLSVSLSLSGRWTSPSPWTKIEGEVPSWLHLTSRVFGLPPPCRLVDTILLSPIPCGLLALRCPLLGPSVALFYWTITSVTLLRP